jgi:hypothetical protein
VLNVLLPASAVRNARKLSIHTSVATIILKTAKLNMAHQHHPPRMSLAALAASQHVNSIAISYKSWAASAEPSKTLDSRLAALLFPESRLELGKTFDSVALRSKMTVAAIVRHNLLLLPSRIHTRKIAVVEKHAIARCLQKRFQPQKSALFQV